MGVVKSEGISCKLKLEEGTMGSSNKDNFLSVNHFSQLHCQFTLTFLSCDFYVVTKIETPTQ